MKRVTVSVADWVYQELISSARNKSEKVQELIIKGHLYEKEKTDQKNKEMRDVLYEDVLATAQMC